SGGATLTVGEGAKLECAIQNNANIVVESGGKLYTTMGGQIINRNTLTVNAGGEMKSQMGGEIVNCEDAKIILDGEMYCGCIGFGGGDSCWFENSGEITGNGKITLYEAAPYEMPVEDMNALADSVRTAVSGAGEQAPEVLVLGAHTPGDINKDGSVNNKDLTALLKCLTGEEVDVDENALDITKDGNINNKDLIRLFKYLSGWDVKIY
ncbi:MAG: dockerin type I repeat-containing protein, partial [Clostridia bacterium]|nr:dockerin type I repeat-containing protein [Clostridia bacterium]